MNYIPNSIVMLTTITYTTHVLAMAISLWMAFYLFARGYPNRITLRAVLALLAISVFFLGTYNYFQSPALHTIQLRAALLVIALVSWYSTTFTLLTQQKQTRYRWMEITIYVMGGISVILLVAIESTEGIKLENLMYTAYLESNLVNILYGTTQVTAAIGILFNLTIQERIRYTTEGKYYFLASLFLIFALAYGILSLVIDARFPRVIQDGLVFGGIFLLGISIARHQSLVERRTIWQDFPIAMLGMSGVVAFYLIICYWLKIPKHLWGNIVALVITTHSLYDLGREAVERWRKKEENLFRRKAHVSRKLADEVLRSHLDQELSLLLKTLNAAGGLIAIRQDNALVVVASRKSLPVNSKIPDLPDANEELLRIEGKLTGLVWIFQAFEGMESIALVGIGPSNTKLEYSTGDLELLEEFTEQVGTFISISKSHNNEIQSAPERLTESLALPPEGDWGKIVEDALRRFSDFLSLGESPLTECIGIKEESQIERGKQVQAKLGEAIQSLRPQGERPPEPLPREWYNFVVLYDAYVKGVPNREVMARLFVSEGTFHRIRRHAVRGVARYLAEKKRLRN